MAEDEAFGESQRGALHGTESSLEKECLAWKLLCPGRDGTLMMTFVTWGWFDEICSLGRPLWLQCRRYTAVWGDSGLQRPASGLDHENVETGQEV